MKVFFDIGTNKFQGYDELAKKFKIGDDWHKVFVEPNPDFVQSDELMSRLNSIPNSKFFPAALCCDCGSQDKVLMAIENGYHMDQGSNIFRKDWVEQGRKTVEVSVITFDELCKSYTGEEWEWYMKFDCEGCEWSCLLDIIKKHHKHIQNLTVEFHYPCSDPDAEKNILSAISEYGIPSFDRWH